MNIQRDIIIPETNSSPLKIDSCKRRLVLETSIFRGYVSFREGKGLFNQWFPVSRPDGMLLGVQDWLSTGVQDWCPDETLLMMHDA